MNKKKNSSVIKRGDMRILMELYMDKGGGQKNRKNLSRNL